jgi:orotate phosphoribosyltransferase-like protein
MKQRVIEEIKKKAVNGKLPCMIARTIAEELGVSYETVGKAADKLKVKITNCQLGCF